MNEMKLRIARALEPQFDALYPDSKDSVLDDVANVLRAMREPPEAMCEAGENCPMRPYDVWRAMIDEALK